MEWDPHYFDHLPTQISISPTMRSLFPRSKTCLQHVVLIDTIESVWWQVSNVEGEKNEDITKSLEVKEKTSCGLEDESAPNEVLEFQLSTRNFIASASTSSLKKIGI